MRFTVFALLVIILIVSAASQVVDLSDDTLLFLRERERGPSPRKLVHLK